MSADAVIVCGSDFTRLLTIVNSNDGSAFNLTGYTLTGKCVVGDVSKTVTCSVLVAATGSAQIDIDQALTDDFPAPAWGEIEIVATAGAVREPVGRYTVRTEPQVAA